ncbi:MAG: ATP-binding protein [Candidatus Binatia bacterium]
MFRTLYSKLVLVLLGFGAMTAVVSIAVLRFSHETYHLEANQNLNRELALRLVSEIVLSNENPVSQAAVQSVFDRLTLINPDIDVYLLDEAGRVLASSGRSGRVERNKVDLLPVQRFLDDSGELPILGDDPSDQVRKQIFSVAPISIGGHPGGYLYLILRGQHHDSNAAQLKRSYALREGMGVVAAGVLLAGLVSALIISLLTRRLKRLVAVMGKFRQGGFAEQPSPHADPAPGPADEIDHLSITFNEMEDRILTQMQELKQTDAMRRELLVNISHDLRTPLTSLRGHLEILQSKENNLTPEEKGEYLEIAEKESARLSKLVSKLFELAKLDASQAPFYPEPFVLFELVQDIAQKFELAAANKQVTLKTDFPEHLPLVVGDIGLIERALENLIENALRYTPEGGRVTIKLIPGEGHVAVQVSDSGRGIAPEDLPKIFDRFYRGEKSRPASSESAGLGLAIVKRILELHHSSIQVESSPGVGTVFTFTLAVAVASDRRANALVV